MKCKLYGKRVLQINVVLFTAIDGIGKVWEGVLELVLLLTQ